METQPLLADKKSGRSSRSGSGLLAYSRPPSSDNNTEHSVYSYCGDNFLIPPDRRQPRSTTVDTQNSVEEVPTRIFHWPLFISVVTLVHCGLVIYVCVAGGIEPIDFKPEVKSETINKFGFIASANKLGNSTDQEKVERYCGVNGFIGPNSSFLVQVGAKYAPCMKKLEVIENRIKEIDKRETDFRCCSFHGECGMIARRSCPGKTIGFSMNCSSSSQNCTHGVTLRPCCAGLHSQCHVISLELCSFLSGQWHDDKVWMPVKVMSVIAVKRLQVELTFFLNQYMIKLLCSQVNCLDDICGMSGVKNKTGGHQWYRLITPIFLHLGVIHLVTNLFFQIPVGILIEREIGTVRTCLIYMISGIGGNLVCGLLNPLSPQVGASGALFGLIGLLIIKLLQLRHNVHRPCFEALLLLGVALISFALGTLPYIGNFVHIGGFVFGLLASLAFLPRTSFRGRSLVINTVCSGIFLLILLVLLAVTCVTFFSVKDSQFCSWCQYIDCVPYTTNFCPDMNSDGYSDNADET